MWSIYRGIPLTAVNVIDDLGQKRGILEIVLFIVYCIILFNTYYKSLYLQLIFFYITPPQPIEYFYIRHCTRMMDIHTIVIFNSK